ncbi:HEAT repeat domain-containing protein [Cerasicoccus maritimus]|uniref:HEAT repeat domain-containing protein n=1 Tax=Cerasicoccus maritimus TaxID=490089 RepID=UPI00285261DF|nr:HEAT repeat domain-containing protein [Cerasicoccus maritimus]
MRLETQEQRETHRAGFGGVVARAFQVGIASLLFASPLAAQSNRLDRSILPPELLPAPRLSQQERETITRAIRDLESDNVELRAGAAMLLGKYHAPEAKQAVIDALNDPSARVRRAALVSVAEWRHGLPVDDVEPILLHIADVDVEVRRMVSSMIPQMMSIWRTARMIRPEMRNREINPQVRGALRGAFSDEDAVVRRNMLINFNNLSITLPQEVLVQLMEDPDRGVRLDAIPLAINYAEPALWVEPAQRIVEGDDPAALQRLTAELGRRGSNEGIELLQEISALDNQEIAAEAHLALFRWTGSPAELDWLIKALAAGRLSQDQGQRLLQIMRGYHELAVPLAPSLTELKSTVLRAEAVRLYLGLELANDNPEVMARLLNDPSQEIRAMVVSHYNARPQLVTDELVLSLLDNPYSDVRASLVQMAIRQPRKKAENLLYDLMLDEAVDVRVASMEAISALQFEGWTDIVAASLEDPDIAMQRSAVVILLRERQFPQREEILRGYVEANPKSPLAPRIKTELGGGQVIEIDMNNL